jgi:hypothetical protein
MAAALALVGAGAAEAAAFWIVLRAPSPWWPAALAAHAIAAGLAGGGLGGGRRDGRFLVVSVVLALPALGLVGLGAIRLWLRLAGPSRLYTDIHSEMLELPGPSQAPEPVDRVFDWLQTQVSVRPLADLIRAGDPRTQRWAIELLAKRGDGPAVDLLREALQAEDRDTQIAASSALQRVEERLALQISHAQERLREEPDSPGGLLALGDACRTYQASGLLDPVMGRHWLTEAEAAYRRALGLRPGWRVPMLALARVLLALGRAHEAEAVAMEARTAAPSEDTDLLLSEILFTQRRWRDLQALCRDAVSARRGDDLLHWWAGPMSPKGEEA